MLTTLSNSSSARKATTRVGIPNKTGPIATLMKKSAKKHDEAHKISPSKPLYNSMSANLSKPSMCSHRKIQEGIVKKHLSKDIGSSSHADGKQS